MIGALESLQTGKIQTLGEEGSCDPLKKPIRTGFLKTPTEYQIWLNTTGLQGDFVADTKHHGGEDKAILGFSLESYNALNLPLIYGGFGENLTIAGMDESTVCIGDRYRIGETLIEVSQPRQPCFKIAHRWQSNEVLKMVQQKGLTGWYFRVLNEGYLQKGMLIKRIARPNPEWSIAKANEILLDPLKNHKEASTLYTLPELAEAWKRDLGRRLKY